jgi:hypothetical protein
VTKPAPKSCLDWLWEAVAARGRLRAEQPAVLAHALRALLAMWQVQGPRAVHLFRMAEPTLTRPASAGC